MFPLQPDRTSQRRRQSNLRESLELAAPYGRQNVLAAYHLPIPFVACQALYGEPGRNSSVRPLLAPERPEGTNVPTPRRPGHSR